MRLIPLPIHAALSMLGGLALMAAPLALGLSLAATILGLVLGAILVGLALDKVDDGRRELPLSAHFSFDVIVGVGLVAAALAVALAGDLAAGILFSLGALTLLLLTLATRYSGAR